MFEVPDVNKRILNLRYNDLLGKVCEFYEIAKGGKDFEEGAKTANDPNVKERFELLFQMTQCLEVKFKYIQMFEKYIVDPPLMSGIEDVVEELKVVDKQESDNPQPQNNDNKTIKGIKCLSATGWRCRRKIFLTLFRPKGGGICPRQGEGACRQATFSNNHLYGGLHPLE